ncbi:MAG TPA: DUF2917 domain-containing protein, partial [Waterburya sp.]
RLAKTNALAKTFYLSTILYDLGSYFSQFLAFNKLFHEPKSLIQTQLTLKKNEVIRVPLAAQKVQVLSGTAWITVAGEDILLQAGEKAALPSQRNFAVLSALGDVPLIVDVL